MHCADAAGRSHWAGSLSLFGRFDFAATARKLTVETEEQAALEKGAGDCPDTVAEYEVAPQEDGGGRRGKRR